MRPRRLLPYLQILLLAACVTPGSTRRPIESTPLAELRRALAARGTAEAFTFDFARTYTLPEGLLTVRGRLVMSGPTRQRFELCQIDGTRTGSILDRDRGWEIDADAVRPFSTVRVSEEQPFALLSWMSVLGSPADVDLLQPVPEDGTTWPGRDVIGVSFAREIPTRPEFFFDARTGDLLLRRAVEEVDGRRHHDETRFEDHRLADGVRYAARITIRRDGAVVVRTEVHEARFSAALDDAWFDPHANALPCAEQSARVERPSEEAEKAARPDDR